MRKIILLLLIISGGLFSLSSILRRFNRTSVSLPSKCVGVDWLTRSCRIKNLCFNGKQFVTTSPVENTETSMFPFHTEYTRKQQEFKKTALFELTHVETIPHDAVMRRGTTILFGEYNAENFGHVMNDSALPWFKLLDMFDVAIGSVTGVIRVWGSIPLNWSCDSRIALGKMKDRAKCDKFLNAFSQRAFGVDVEPQDSLGWTCFETALFGIGLLSDHGFDYSAHGLDGVVYEGPTILQTLVSSGSLMRRFRDNFLRRNDVQMDPKKLVVINRPPPKGAANTMAFVDRIRDKFTRVVVLNDMGSMTLSEQIDAFSDAGTVVMSPGGGSMIAQMAPNGATIHILRPRASDTEFWLSLPHYNIVTHVIST